MSFDIAYKKMKVFQQLLDNRDEEARRMTEIRIGVKTGETCEYPGIGRGKTCHRRGRSWNVLPSGETIFIICKEHGEPIRKLLENTNRIHGGSFFITGGYDDEPVSKLVQRRHKFLHEREGLADTLMLHHAVVDIFDYLIEREADNAK